MEHTPEEIARAIANGHGYDHVSYSREHWKRDLGISTRDEYEKHILETLHDKDTKAFETMKGGVQFYNDRTNTHIGYDPKAADLGTCQRPTSQERNFMVQWLNDCDLRRDWSLERMSQGNGIEGLAQVEQVRSHDQNAPKREPDLVVQTGQDHVASNGKKQRELTAEQRERYEQWQKAEQERERAKDKDRDL